MVKNTVSTYEIIGRAADDQAISDLYQAKRILGAYRATSATARSWLQEIEGLLYGPKPILAQAALRAPSDLLKAARFYRTVHKQLAKKLEACGKNVNIDVINAVDIVERDFGTAQCRITLKGE